MHTSGAKSKAIALIAVITLWSGFCALAADKDNPPVEEMTRARASDRQIIRAVARIMDKDHLSKHRLDDEISQRTYEQLFRSLDPLKLYFLQSDMDEFKYAQTKLDDFALAGSMDFAIEVFKAYLKRVDERVAMAHELIDQEHDFTHDEQLAIERDVIEYAKDEEEARDRMRRQIKYRLLVFESDRLRAEKDKADGKEQSEAANVIGGDPNEDPRERLHRSYRNLQKRWHQTDADDLLELYVSAMTSSFDPHTSYMSNDTLENFKIVMGLELEGIGATLTSEDGYTKLASIVVGGAADKDGRLKPGDKIVAVAEGEAGSMVDVIDMKLDDVVAKIRGSAGTVVRLTVQPADGSETKIYDITRAKISLEDSAARSEVIEHGQKPDGSPFRFGYIDLPSFYMDMEAASDKAGESRSTTRDVKRILIDFKQNNVDAVLLDLSRNGGGSLTEAINLTGLFIDQGPVVQVKDLSGRVEVYNDDDAGVQWDGPLVVMTSKESASASEILAGAIQDYGRGLIVGDPTTHGKGTVQQMIGLDRVMAMQEAGALKLTIQQFYLPGGQSTQRTGVPSDIILPAITASFDNSEADLDYALPNDQVREASHADYKMVDSTLLAKIREQSLNRVRESDGFARLLKRIEMYDAQKGEEFVSLNRDAFMKRRADMDAQREEEVQSLESQLPKKDVFKKDYYTTEVLNVARDYVEAVNQLNLAQAG